MKNEKRYSRRDFVRISGVLSVAGLTGCSSTMALAKEKKFRIGSTYILWGYSADALEPSLKDMSALGFHSFETFGWVIQEWEENRGGFSEVVAKYNIPITSAFCATEVIDPSKRKDELAKLKKWTKYLRDAGGTVVEYCPSSINRSKMNYDYKEHKKNLVESMNDYAMLVNDMGLACALHPHTGTPIETEEEVYFIMDNVDTRYMKFGPDVGQLEKGGADPVKICNDYMELIEHVHLKDYGGGEYYAGYSPLGEGIVNIKKILTMLEKRRDKMTGGIMFELDFSGKNKIPPRTPDKVAELSRNYLKNLGYKFNV